ncbi:hypothetical protein GGI20_001130 [Coemansia sp. BCRC 34301]|nr:hypothetical protein GGI20_001130 [Coemansia sp. BCRC 34301]
MSHVSWLPTDFTVNDDGTVTIHLYINNLHPTQYADLYQDISKVFAKFVPLLEQVTTDLIRSSVEMASINLTPDNPVHPESRWQAMGRCVEKIVAVGHYFYVMENIASAKLKLRDPIKEDIFQSKEELEEFCHAHNVVDKLPDECKFSQEFEGIEAKCGRYICLQSPMSRPLVFNPGAEDPKGKRVDTTISDVDDFAMETESDPTQGSSSSNSPSGSNVSSKGSKKAILPGISPVLTRSRSKISQSRSNSAAKENDAPAANLPDKSNVAAKGTKRANRANANSGAKKPTKRAKR